MEPYHMTPKFAIAVNWPCGDCYFMPRASKCLICGAHPLDDPLTPEEQKRVDARVRFKDAQFQATGVAKYRAVLKLKRARALARPENKGRAARGPRTGMPAARPEAQGMRREARGGRDK